MLNSKPTHAKKKGKERRRRRRGHVVAQPRIAGRKPHETRQPKAMHGGEYRTSTTRFLPHANATTDAKSNEGFGDEAALGNKPPIGNARLRERAMQQRKGASALELESGSTGEHEQQQIRRRRRWWWRPDRRLRAWWRWGCPSPLLPCNGPVVEGGEESRRGEREEGGQVEAVHMTGHWPGWEFACRPLGGREDACVPGAELQNCTPINQSLVSIPNSR